MKEHTLKERVFRAIYRYFLFFLLAAFLVTCTTSLFVTVLSTSLGVELTNENIQTAAKLTFLNVVVLSLLFTVIDAIRRETTTKKIAKHISDAAKEITDGDFSVRIKPVAKFAADENFNEIIDCFNTMAEELSSVETLRTDFIANVSHEMKTPITVIRNYARLLSLENLSEEKRLEYASAITDASKRLSDMMTNILKLSKLENQNIRPKSERFNLSESLVGALLQYEGVWEEKEIDIDTDIKDDVFISSDEELLSLVWNNLLSNAFKFTDKGGKVSLSLVTDSEYATVKISDTGCGMSSDVGEHIFEKFYQGDTSHSTRGNGLGLSLVKRVVDITDAEISVESTVGKGSVFTVKIAL